MVKLSEIQHYFGAVTVIITHIQANCILWTAQFDKAVSLICCIEKVIHNLLCDFHLE